MYWKITKLPAKNLVHQDCKLVCPKFTKTHLRASVDSKKKITLARAPQNGRGDSHASSSLGLGIPEPVMTYDPTRGTKHTIHKPDEMTLKNF